MRLRQASFLIKPVSGRCNLTCGYCFYRDEANRRALPDRGRMSSATAGLLLDRAFEAEADSYSFAFQGGEPTLAGLDFFEGFARRAREEKPHGAELRFSIQTNGLLIDEAWVAFLRREDFLVGLSLDGSRRIHDSRRKAADGSGSWTRSMAAADRLREGGVPVNALCVVDALVADNAALVYSALRSRGFDWLQFIPCLDPLGELPGSRPWSLTPSFYAAFLCTLFDLWQDELAEGRTVHIRWFDDLVALAAGQAPSSCGMAGRCGSFFVVEADGSIYPCDFYALDEWRLGDLGSGTRHELARSETAGRFLRVSEAMDPACEGCFAHPLCQGGCRRDREPFIKGRLLLNRHCAAYQTFFRHAGDRIMELAGTLVASCERRPE
jgi:uncharacterized protein